MRKNSRNLTIDRKSPKRRQLLTTRNFRWNLNENKERRKNSYFKMRKASTSLDMEAECESFARETSKISKQQWKQSLMTKNPWRTRNNFTRNTMSTYETSKFICRRLSILRNNFEQKIVIQVVWQNIDINIVQGKISRVYLRSKQEFKEHLWEEETDNFPEISFQIQKT